jgi:transcriptional regulator with PAS, ATPase and Fis domain
MTRFKLLVIGDSEPVAHLLPSSGDVTIGRSDAADIQVNDPQISRIHAVIHVGPELAVSDLGSSNGTLVRGSKVAPETRVSISVGEVIDFSSTIVIVQREFTRSHSRARELDQTNDDARIAPQSDPMQRLNKLVRRIAGSRINVLLLGETGVGKEVMASSIHRLSPRGSAPFLGLNCAALNEQLFESELFGYEKGAFTGANQAKPGLIETANGGTMFLDEVGEMPLPAQAKLLRVLEEREVFRVGGLKSEQVDVRFVAATNRDLEADVAAGRFREDLYYRLNGITLVIPPLRERKTEIPSLARSFIAEACRDAGYDALPLVSPAAADWMQTYAWPGNIRELKNAVNRAVLLATGGAIQPEHLVTSTGYRPRQSAEAPESAPATAPSASPVALDDARQSERERIIEALTACGGNQTRAAKLLGISRRTLSTRLNELNIPRPRKGA